MQHLTYVLITVANHIARSFGPALLYPAVYPLPHQHGWSKKRRHDGTDDGTPGGRYDTGHCPVVVYVRRTHDGTLARGIVQATGQTRHVSLPVVMWFVITFLT